MAQQTANDALMQQYRNCISLEQKLREESKHKNFYEPDVRAVRMDLRLAYESLLFLDYTGAQAREVEPALWKSVFYRPIEEFRRRIKAAAVAGEKGRAPLQKVKLTFGRFLQDAALFYRQLACKLQAAYGAVGFSLEEAQLQTAPAVPDHQYILQDCKPSVYRCLICLGDIFRYETSVLQSQSKKDWSAAAKHYRLAMNVYPSGGNSYNQLAVLATYNEDDLAAVYYYFRSLAAAKPFAIARENLVLLLEQIRVKYTKLPQRVQPKTQTQKLPMKSKRPVNVLMQDLSIRLAHVHGILFSKVNLNDCDEVLPAAMADLHDLLGRQGALQAFLHKGPTQQRSEHVLLQLAVLSMFSMHDIAAASAEQQLRYAEVMKQDVLKQAVHRVVQSVIAALAAAVAQASPTQGSEPTGKLVLPTLAILLEWWALHPDYSTPVNIPQPVGTTDPEVAARLDCINHLTSLLLTLQAQATSHKSDGSDGGHVPGVSSPSGQQFALTEDWQLRGFLPLQQSHHQLVFEKQDVQEETPKWAQRALQALHGIASHPVNLDFATPAAAPIASRQLAQAWQAFKAAVTRSSLPEVSPMSTAGVLVSDAAAVSSAVAAEALVPDAVAASSAAAAEALVPSAVAASSAAAAAAPSGDVTGAEHGWPGMGQQVDTADDPEDEEVIVFQPQRMAGSLARAAPPAPALAAAVQPAGIPSNQIMSGPESYAHIAAAAGPGPVSHQGPQAPSQQQQLAHQHVQAGLLTDQNQTSAAVQQAPRSQQQQQDLQSALQQQQQQQQQQASRPAAYATGIASFPPTLPPSSALLSTHHASHQGAASNNAHAASGSAMPTAPLNGVQQLRQQVQQVGPTGQAPGWPSQNMGGKQYIAEVEQTRQMSASVPAASHAEFGANGNGSKIGSSGNLQVMSSMAFGLGTSAVGSPGFGQFLGPNPSSLVSSAAMNPQLGGDQTLFSRQEAVPSGGNQHPGTYHPFGSSGSLNVGLQNTGLNQGFSNTLSHSSSGHALGLSHPHLGQLNTQQRAPLPYPGQAASSLNGSLGYSANLSSAGSDRASPSSLLGRTNLAAHMGFGSNPNLQSLDQLQTRLPQRQQLTWQQQLLAQQQHQSPIDSYGFQNQHAGGFQNHHSHHLPAVPTWQNPTNSFQQNLGHIGHPASHSLLPQPLQGSYPMQLDSLGPGQGFVNPPQSQVSSLNWQQQLQQQHVQGPPAGLHQQGMPQAGSASVHSPSPAAADSWSWLDDFEHKQQAEHLTGAAYQASNLPNPGVW
ncbi:TPA: hypothetical protein ACH3X1_011469 [Trebouxia sp. C0004]